MDFCRKVSLKISLKSLFDIVQTNQISYTSCSSAPVAPHHAASRHADQPYGQSINIIYSTFRDPGR